MQVFMSNLNFHNICNIIDGDALIKRGPLLQCQNYVLMSKGIVELINYCSNNLFNISVTAKIRNLHDCQLRLLHNVMPVPSGVDVANTLKYFSQTLLSKCTCP